MRQLVECFKDAVGAGIDGNWRAIAPENLTPVVNNEQRTFTDGRIMVAGRKVWRRPQKRADYLLRYRPNLMLAVVEAKASPGHVGDAPVQVSAMSQTPAEPRHTVPDEDKLSPGQAPLEPEHVSAGSHTPAEARQVCPPPRN